MLSVNSTNANKQQTMQETWKRTKKLFMQFLPLTVLFAVTDLPWAIRQALRSIFPDFLNGISAELEVFLAYLTVLYQLLIVFTIFLNQQELRSKFRQLIKKMWMKVRRRIFGMNAVEPLARAATVGTASYFH
ncbi:unnamed protein product [Adineta steineri]|uniref:Uncharacterized protein n=1 Tax=Adineta steineri TaxID=433720 RepID=A0A815NBK1_9BILA|nr:unnamed protein product [Adineta steineri]CAF1435384.1 unnamed protein product [Adineta steineri]